MPRPLADSLIVTMTRQGSLRAWADAGLLEREWALYEALGDAYPRIILATYGEVDRELALGQQLRPAPEIVTLPSAADAEAQRRFAAHAITQMTHSGTSALVKTNQFFGGDVAIAIADALRAAGTRVALVARGGYPWSRCEAWEHGADSPQTQAARDDERRLLCAADLVIATTQGMAGDLAWRYGLPDDRFRVVPNYVPPPTERASGEQQREPGAVLFAGRLASQKRVDLLIRAVAELARRKRRAAGPVRLDIVGEGPLAGDLRSLAESLSAPVAFLPREDHHALRRRMRRCAVYAQASAYEGHPKTVLEAMAEGAAVLVADNAPGLTGLIRHGETGWTAEAEPAALADALERLLGDNALRSGLGAAAAERVLGECALDRVATLERAAHRDAVERSRTTGDETPAAPLNVTWPADLLDAPLDAQTKAWRNSLHGFQKRLDPKQRAQFLMAMDDPIYQMQGEAAVAAEGGLHPKHRLMKYHDFFIKRVARGERVLDLGCGNGALACAIANGAQARVAGVDINESAIRTAQHRAQRLNVAHLAQFVVADIVEQEVEGRFDVIALSNVLEHLPGRAHLLRRWLTAHGPRVVLIRVPSFERDWRVPWKRELNVEWRLDPTHEIEHRRDELARELAEGGLAPTEWLTVWGEHWVAAEPSDGASAQD